MEGFPVPRELFLLHIVPQMRLTDFIRMTQTCKPFYQLQTEQWPWCFFFHLMFDHNQLARSALLERLCLKYQYLIYYDTPSSKTHLDPCDFKQLLKTRLEEQMKLRKMCDALHVSITFSYEHKSDLKWEEVKGCKEAKQSLKELIWLPCKFPNLFTGLRRPCKSILLYGPPGCGKTYLAKAFSAEHCGSFLSASACDFVSKWLGESEKIIRNLFEMANSLPNSILFIDQIDLIEEREYQHCNRQRTEFLRQRTRCDGGYQCPLAAGYGNKEKVCGPDFGGLIRRFEKFIYIGLPDAEARVGIMKQTLSNVPHEITEEQFTMLGDACPGYSCSDISCVIRDAMMIPVREVQVATHFKKYSSAEKNIMKPCLPSDEGAVEVDWTGVDPETLAARNVTVDDVLHSMQKIRPSVTDQDIARFHQFQNDYELE